VNNKVLDHNIENANKVADNNLKQTKQQIEKYIVSVVTKRLCNHFISVGSAYNKDTRFTKRVVDH